MRGEDREREWVSERVSEYVVGVLAMRGGVVKASRRGDEGESQVDGVCVCVEEWGGGGGVPTKTEKLTEEGRKR